MLILRNNLGVHKNYLEQMKMLLNYKPSDEIIQEILKQKIIEIINNEIKIL